MKGESLSRDLERAIRNDYEARTDEGKPRYAIVQIADRNGVSPMMVNVVRRKWGMRRNLAHGH